MRVKMGGSLQCFWSASSTTSCGYTSENAFNAGLAFSLSASARAFAFRRLITRAIVGSALCYAI